MPPIDRTSANGLGWKLFFGLLMFLQVIATTVMFRTHDAVQTVTRTTELNEYKIDHVVTPRLDRLEARAGVALGK